MIVVDFCVGGSSENTDELEKINKKKTNKLMLIMPIFMFVLTMNMELHNTRSDK